MSMVSRKLHLIGAAAVAVVALQGCEREEVLDNQNLDPEFDNQQQQDQLQNEGLNNQPAPPPVEQPAPIQQNPPTEPNPAGGPVQ